MPVSTRRTTTNVILNALNVLSPKSPKSISLLPTTCPLLTNVTRDLTAIVLSSTFLPSIRKIRFYWTKLSMQKSASWTSSRIGTCWRCMRSDSVGRRWWTSRIKRSLCGWFSSVLRLTTSSRLVGWPLSNLRGGVLKKHFMSLELNRESCLN